MSNTTILRVLLVAFVALMSGALGYWYVRRRGNVTATVTPSPAPSAELVARLAALDASFERMQPADADSRARYDRDRAELKSRIARALAEENQRA